MMWVERPTNTKGSGIFVNRKLKRVKKPAVDLNIQKLQNNIKNKYKQYTKEKLHWIANLKNWLHFFKIKTLQRKQKQINIKHSFILQNI